MDHCTVLFLKQVLSGKKLFYHNSDVKMIKVPKLLELSSKNVYQMAMQHEHMRKYLPDPIVDGT